MSLALDRDQIIIINDVAGDHQLNIQLISMVREIGDITRRTVIVFEFYPVSANVMKTYFSYGADLVVDVAREGRTVQDIKRICYHEIRESQPFLLVLGSTYKNRELAASLSVMLDAGLVADCFQLRLDKRKDRVVFTRAAINSSVLADIVCENSPVQMCTIKKGCSPAKQCAWPRPQNVYRHNGDCWDPQEERNICLLNKMPIRHQVLPLEQNEKLIIGVGRGASKYLTIIETLASKMDAVIGASKPMVEDGIISRNQQIGQSGHSIRANVYLALGISGAMQHVVGISAVKTIIAVNTDREAPIRRFSDFFICDDVKNVVSTLLD